MTPKQIKEVLEKHGKWLRGEEGGERANFRGADLRRANFRWANLRGANFRWTDLQEANFRGANLRGANFRGAYLWIANFREADLQEADLWRAGLWRASLRGANLRGANLEGADLLCFGNMREIRTMQIDTRQIGYTADTLQIGCQRHPIDKWRKWNTEAGRKWIERMDSKVIDWADRNLGLVLQIIDANPATPTGHEIEARSDEEDRG